MEVYVFGCTLAFSKQRKYGATFNAATGMFESEDEIEEEFEIPAFLRKQKF